MPFKVGDTIQHRRTGQTAEVTMFNPVCGNVYVGPEKQEIEPAAWKRETGKAPEKRVAPHEQPQPVAANGNGHATTVPPLATFVGREKEPVR